APRNDIISGQVGTKDRHLREHECFADFAEGDAFRCLPQRKIAQVAIFWHSSAQALQASPQSLHSVILGNLSHSFLQSLQIISTVLARWPVCSELTAASVFSAAQAATS